MDLYPLTRIAPDDASHRRGDPTSPRKRGEVKTSHLSIFPVFEISPRRVRQLALQRFAIAQAAAQKFWPGRDGHFGRDPLGQQAPEIGMVPAQVVTGAVAVRADARSETLHLRDQLVAAQCFEVAVGVHVTAPRLRGLERDDFSSKRHPALSL